MTRNSPWPPVLAVVLMLAGLGAGLVRAAETPWLGVLLGDAIDGGVQLVAVVPGGPAERDGLRTGDVVVGASGARVAAVEDLELALAGKEPGDSLALQVLRQGTAVELVILLGERSTRWPRSNPAAIRAAPEVPQVPLVECGPYGLCVAEVTPDLRRYYGAPEGAGVLVTGVVAELPAAVAGLQVGDVLIRLGEAQVQDEKQLSTLLDEKGGETVAWVVRGREPTALTLSAPSRSVSVSVVAPEVRNSASVERAIEAEIERLKRRMRELEGRLERLREARPD